MTCDAARNPSAIHAEEAGCWRMYTDNSIRLLPILLLNLKQGAAHVPEIINFRMDRAGRSFDAE